MTFAAKLIGTAPPTPAAHAIGFAHATVRTAISDLEHGRTAYALSTLQTTLAMLDSALVPELRIGEQS